MVQWINVLLYKLEDLSSESQHKLVQQCKSVIPNLEGGGRSSPEAHWPARVADALS